MDIEDIYPLTPLQQGLLFHTIGAGGEIVYIESQRMDLVGPLRADWFEESWRRVIQRHPILRSAFVWEGLKEPLQAVRKRAAVPLTIEDWRQRSDVERARLDEHLARLRTQSFDLGRAPVMRLNLIRVDQDRHVFLWSRHHLVLDGWSSGLVMKQVLQTYEALCRGEEPAPLATERPYSEYVAWLRGQDMERAEAVWREELHGFSAPTQLDMPGTAGAVGTTVWERETLLSRKSTEALEATGRKHKVTLNTLVQGAWALLLRRYSGDRDVVFGATVNGRPPTFHGAEQMVGVFINTLPVRVQVQDEKLVGEWLSGIQARQMRLRPYDYTPLAMIQQWSDTRGGVPLFGSILVFDNPPHVGGPPRASIQANNIVHHRSVTNYPVAVSAGLVNRGAGDQLSLRITCRSEKLDARATESLLAHLTVLLEGIGEARDQTRVVDLPMLAKTERHQLLKEWNKTSADYPRQRCIHELFEDQAASNPSSIALVRDHERMTCAELDRRANQLAHHLRMQGVDREVVVGLCVERSFEIVIGLLAILKAGGAYLPLDPALPPERLRFMLEDAQVRHLVTQEALHAEPLLSATGGIAVCLERDHAEIERHPGTAPISQIGADQLAYVIYTSGSTGRPKAVMVEHGSVVNLLNSVRKELGVERADRLLGLTTLGFDIAALEIFLPLLTGAQLVLLGRWEALDAMALSAAIQASGVTVMQATPATWQLLLSAGWSGDPALKALCGGEALPIELSKRLVSRVDELWNMYGPTETTIWSCTRRITAGSGPAASIESIGRPVANTQVYVLDEHLEPVPIGAAGDLYIAGTGLARGYLYRAGLTAERFVANPHGPAGSRLYRTGDRARYRADGNLEFLGRADHQVKIRGFRIEPGEIEARLLEHADVHQAVVVVGQGKSGDAQLIGYVVKRADAATIEAAQLRTHLKLSLPEYMIPSSFVVLEKLPLNANGKVDRKALPALEGSEPVSDRFEPPATPTEELLAWIWADVLRIDQVGVNDNFFDLGGHSLLVTRLMAWIRESLSVDVPLRLLFEELVTVRELARYIERVRHEPRNGDQAQDGAIPNEVMDPSGSGHTRMLL